MKRVLIHSKPLLSLAFILASIYLCGQVDTTKTAAELKYPFTTQTGGLYLDNPVQVTATYDTTLGLYYIQQQVAGEDIAPPVYMTPDEYSKFVTKRKMVDYYLRKSREYDDFKRSEKGIRIDKSGLIPGITIKSKAFKRIFGGDQISLSPNGYASFDFGVHYQKIDNPQVPPENRKQFDIDIDQRIQMSLLGKIGENLQLKANYDTQAGFAFENKMNFRFSPSLNDLTGGEDNIIQNIEVGNVSFPLRSSFMKGPSDLFGAKVETKWGKTYISAVFSEQRSQSKTVTAEKGGLVESFDLKATDYESNANFFLSAYHRQQYNYSLSSYPLKTNATITNIEVWVKNRSNTSLGTKRSIVALRDLGNNAQTAPNLAIPKNDALYNSVSGLSGIRDYYAAKDAILNSGLGLEDGKDFVVEENMRLLNASEYTYNPQLGTLFLNQPVNDDEVIAVAYRIKDLANASGATITDYKLGELTSEISGNETEANTKTIITRMLKGRSHNPDTNKSLWDMMMKNVYALSALPFSADNFRFDVVYNDAQLGYVNYLNSAGTTTANRILAIQKLDRLNNAGQTQNGGDGMFDFLSGTTVSATAGKIIFSTVEPFGATLANYQSPGTAQSVANESIYNELKDNQTGENSKNDKFFLRGQYTSSGSSDNISLGAINVPEGSVKVSANGQDLVENVDYTVDYTLGSVKIINETLKQAGTPINISLEDQGLFNLTKQRFAGVNIEHRFSNDFQLGATVMNYKERSTTPKVNYGAEPVNNTMYGFNGFYTHEAPFLTRWINALPLIETKANSNISIKGEVAYLQPGQSKNTQSYSYLDDFESANSNISVKDPFAWSLAAVPGGGNTDYNNGNTDNMTDDLAVNYNRGLLSWYSIDPLFYMSGSPLSKDQLSNNRSRRVRYAEIYPKQDYVVGDQSYITTFDLSYFPQEKGPYNNDPIAELAQNRWSGITRGINVSNFKESNVEYVEFWIMDPYADGYNVGDTGELVLHLGNVSEDVLKDGRKAYENGNPSDGSNDPTIVTPVAYGNVPKTQALVYTFATTGVERSSQDRGMDGLLSKDETTTYTNNTGWINPITNLLDPAQDDYAYYLDAKWTTISGGNNLVERYKYFKNTEGNSPSDTNQYTSLYPDIEDANRDFTMDTQESYYEYKFPINGSLESNSYVVDKRTVSTIMENGKPITTKWYQVRIPVNSPLHTFGTPSLSNIRFARLITKGFQQPTTLRFATFDFVRNNWRRYTGDLTSSTTEDDTSLKPNMSNYNVGVISLTENPDRYVMPPGIDQEEYYNTSAIQKQNEQSLLMQVENLKSNDRVRSIYKGTNLDLRRYKRLEMFVHAEDYKDMNIPVDGDVSVFIRMGTDVTSNYYEYSQPLKVGPEAKAGMDPSTVWNPANKIDFALHDFINLKLDRDAAIKNGTPQVSFTERYPVNAAATDKYIIKGRPSLENVRYIVVGVRLNNTVIAEKNIEVWTNELRLSEIDNKGGFAGVLSLDAQLADFANINATGTYTQAGFGAINEGPTERSQEDVKQYVINTTVNADKLLPENWGMKIPVNYSVGERFIDPLYSPIDTDVKFSEANNKGELESIARDYTLNTSLNLLNIRKIKVNPSAKKHFYDVENLSASLSLNKEYHRDFYIENHTNKTMRLGLNYNYNFKQSYLRPLKDWRAVNDSAKSAPYLQWLKDLNVNVKPSRVSFDIGVDRRTDEFLYRNVGQYVSGFSGASGAPIYSNTFYFNWRYQIGFDLTKSLKLDFTTTRSNIVDNISDPTLDANSGVWDKLTNTGRPMTHNQQMTLNYQVPFNLVPYLDFMQGNITYNANYDWRAVGNNYTEPDSRSLGNIIQNQNTLSFQGGADFETIWNKKTWYTTYQEHLNAYKQEVAEKASDYQTKIDKRKNKKGSKRSIDSKQYKAKLSGKDYLYGLAASVKQVQLNFNTQRSTIIPGIVDEPGFFGVSGGGSPTLGFVMGSQADIRAKAISNQWVTQATIYDPYQKQKSRTFGYTVGLEPFPDLKIDVIGQNDYAQTQQQYAFNKNVNTFMQDVGQFSTSNLSFKSFSSPDALFASLKGNALTIANAKTGNAGNSFPDGYGIAQQEVLMQALLQTYAGHNRSNPISSLPLPNWSLSYSGLTNNRYLNRYFSKIDLTHAYRSTYSVAGINSNVDYYNDPAGKDLNGNVYSDTTYGNITFVETFAPLAGLDMTMRNNLQLRFMYNRDRAQSFSFSNYSLIDQKTNEFQFGLGYLFKDVRLNLRYKGKKKTLKGDMDLRGDLIMRDTQTSILRLIEDDAQITAGTKEFSFKTTLDYKFSQNISLMFFYNHLITKYKISTAYPITDIRAGISAKFIFGQGGK